MRDYALRISEEPKVKLPALSWGMIALTGVIQSCVSLLIFWFSDARLSFIGTRSGYLLNVLTVGLVVVMIGLLGLATEPAGRMSCFIRTGIAFVFPWAAVLIVYVIVPSDHLPHMGLGPAVLLSWGVLALALIMPLATVNLRK